MRHSPAMAARALALAGDLNESAYRRITKFHDTCKANESGGFPASTMHGGGRTTGISDPTGQQAINPEADPARFDLHQAYADLLQATRLLGQVEVAVCAVLGGLPLGPPPPFWTLRTTAHAEQALDLAGYLIERLEQRWEQYHRAAGGLDRGEAYNDLDQALRLLSALDDVMCRWCGGDPVRTHCANQGCPDRNPPVVGRHRCWACDQWLRRHGGEERTRAAEKAETAGVAPGCGVGGPPPAEAVTGPHSGWVIPGIDTYGYDPLPEPVDEGVA